MNWLKRLFNSKNKDKSNPEIPSEAHYRSKKWQRRQQEPMPNNGVYPGYWQLRR